VLRRGGDNQRTSNSRWKIHEHCRSVCPLQDMTGSVPDGGHSQCSEVVNHLPTSPVKSTSHLLMERPVMCGRVLRVVGVSLYPLLQRRPLSTSSVHVTQCRPRTPACVQPRRRSRSYDFEQQWQPSDEAGLVSVQVGRGPPWPLSAFWSRMVNSIHSTQ